ncbi:MAG: hypothetical protein K6G54_03845 [Oscillospiraceae bacterium]|nr:hypothetical protein [Oscillospiraceae bacterium]
MIRRRIAALLLALCLLTGCGANGAPDAQPAEQPSGETAEQADGQNTSAVADASQMTAVQEVVEEGMVPVSAAELNEGEYDIAVSCSSSMFKIEQCTLRVAADGMTVQLRMGSDAYGYFFAGTAEQAAAADASAYIVPEDRCFTLTPDALDAPVQCAAWSVKKELWYDRTLVFRSDSLPLSAFRSVTTAQSLALSDGVYTAEVRLAGGSGRASLQPRARLTVSGGAVTAELVWNSSHYDYMLVDGTRYDAVLVDGCAHVCIPVAAFDRPLAVIADTTAMSQPYEIEYTLTFDSASLAAQP